MAYFIAPDGARLHYRSVGSGRPIVLLHGWTMNGRFFDRNVDTLADRHRVITLDMRGHGRSRHACGPLTMEQLAHDVRALFDELELRGVVLAGWSMGATVVYNYLHRYGSDRLAGAIEIDMTPCLINEDGWEHGAFGNLDTAGALALQHQLVRDRAGFWNTLIPAMFAADTAVDGPTQEWWSDESLAVSDLATLAPWASFSGQDWRPLLSQIEIPMLLAHGTRSQVYPTPVWEFLEKQIPSSRTALFHDSGHSPFWEEPTRFNRSVLDFLGQL